MEQASNTTTESIEVDGNSLTDTVKRVLHEGSVRRIVVKKEERTILDLPLTVGVVGAVLAPALTALGALVALIGDCTIEIERDEPAPAGDPPADVIEVSPAVAGEDGQPTAVQAAGLAEGARGAEVPSTAATA